jgi:cytochrome P450
MHLLFGGDDTTSSTVSFLLYELARHPDLLSRVVSEMAQVLGSRAPTAAERATPQGAYIPLGGGQRVCIGKRFGQLMVKAVACAVLRRFGLELVPGYRMEVSKVPTFSPEGGLPMAVQAR